MGKIKESTITQGLYKIYELKIRLNKQLLKNGKTQFHELN